MELRIEDHANKRRDSVRDRALAKALRGLPDEERHAFIRAMIDVDWGLGVWLVEGCVSNKHELRALFSKLIEGSGPSVVSSGRLIEVFTKKIGMRNVLRILRAKLDTCPHVVDYGLYHLKWQEFSGQSDLEAYHELYREADRRGLIRKPIMVPNPNAPGQVLFKPIPPGKTENDA